MRIAGEIVNSGTRSTSSATWRPRHKSGGLLLFFISGTPIYRKPSNDCLKSCSKNGDTEVSAFQSAAMVPIGRHNFKCRRWFVPRVPSFRAPVARAPWPSGPSPLDRRGTPMQVLVRDNNVDQALKVLKKKMQREGVFREMKLRGRYEKPSERESGKRRKPSAAPASSPAKRCSARVCCR